MKQAIVLGVGAVLLAACQPSEPLLPTLASIGDLQTQAADAPTTPPTIPPAATETPRGLALPPTFTPTPLPPTETPIPTRAPSTPTPNTFEVRGTLYYVIDSRQFVAHDLAADSVRVVREFEPGVLIRDLTLAPDQSLVAFAAQINPLLSEIFVMDLHGNYIQQVSCLRFANAQRPAWLPDSRRLTWFAAPTAGQPGNIYQASVEGSGNCPQDNGQMILVRLELPTFYGMAWDADRLYYVRTDALLTFDPVTQLSATVVPHTGYGPNRFPVVSSRGDVAFIVDRVQPGGQIAPNANIYTAPGPDGRHSVFPTLFPPFVERLVWSHDGRLLLGIGRDQINSRSTATGAVELLADGLTNPVAAFSPDDQLLAYTAPAVGGTTQWVLMELSSKRRRILLNTPAGVISNPIWLER